MYTYVVYNLLLNLSGICNKYIALHFDRTLFMGVSEGSGQNKNGGAGGSKQRRYVFIV